MKYREIWIEYETGDCSVDDNGEDRNSDVIVTLLDGSRWGATFFSFQNLNTLRDRWRVTGECMSGRYFWATWPVFVSILTRAEVEAVVSHMLQTGEFEKAFERIEAAP